MKMKKLLLAIAMAVPLMGCGGRDEDRTQVFNRVEIKRILPPMESRSETMRADGETAAKLAAFFPGMAQGKNSNIAGGWRAGYVLTFSPAKGEQIKITVDSDGKTWSEGQGDWRAKSGLKEYLDGLFEKGNEKESKGEWSEPVNGLRGRLVRYAPPRLNKTAIIGIAVELQNDSTEPLAVRNDPALVRVRLIGPDGQPIDPVLPLVRSGPVASPQWGVLPRDSSLRFSLYDYGVGVPDGQGALLALLPPSRVWMLQPGKYTLRGTFTFQPAASDKTPTNAWKGKLDLPPLEIEVR